MNFVVAEERYVLMDYVLAKITARIVAGQDATIMRNAWKIQAVPTARGMSARKKSFRVDAQGIA